MQLSNIDYFQALQAHDRRFDGLFFTCVTSTGIYCRPICPAIVPRREHCYFVKTTIEAEKAGFRPCLRCRPELAPPHNLDATQPAQKLATYIDETLLMDETLASAAQKFSISERQLRRLFIRNFGVEPKQYVTSRRLLFAKHLLQDTALPITDVAFSAGFNSRGRLTINMKRVYGFTPERLRKESDLNQISPTLQLRADYRPPLDWPALVAFLASRASPNEWVADDIYYRRVDNHVVSVQCETTKQHLVITIPTELSRQAGSILAKVRRLFDLDAEPQAIAAKLGQDSLLAPIIKDHPGLRIPGCWDEFELALRAVIGQQISVANATTMLRRLAEQIGLTPASIIKTTPANIASIGLPLKRATTIWTLANQVQLGQINLQERDPQVFSKQLLAVPGIGPWTVEYLSMRLLGWPDALPTGDLGLQKAVIPNKRLTQKQLTDRAAVWRPWRSYATMLLFTK